MGRSLCIDTSDENIKPVLAQALVKAKKGSNVTTIDQKIGEINSIRTCAEEAHIVLRLFFGDQKVDGFDSTDTNYWEAINEKVKRIYKYICTLSVRDIQLLFLHFQTGKSGKELMKMADEVKNLIEQGKDLEAKIQFFDTFGGSYKISAHGQSIDDTLARRVLDAKVKRFYIDTHHDFLKERKMIPPSIPGIIPAGTTPDVIGSIEGQFVSALEGASNLKKVGKVLTTEFKKFSECIRNIPIIRTILETRNFLDELSQLAINIKIIDDDGIKITQYLLSKEVPERQRKASLDKLSELQVKKIELTKKLQEIKSNLDNKDIKGIPGYQIVSNGIRTNMDLGVINGDDTLPINPKDLDNKIKISILFLNSVGNYLHPTDIQKKLGEMIDFYGKINQEDALIAPEERKKFTLKYIEGVFVDLYREYPKLKPQSPN